MTILTVPEHLLILQYCKTRRDLLSREVDELERQVNLIQRDIHTKRIELKFIQEVLNTEHQ